MSEGRKISWYEMMYVVVLVGLLGWSVFFMNPHKVAIVDMDRVFKDVGVLQKIDKERQKKDFYVKGNSLLQAHKFRLKTLQEKLDATKAETEKDKIGSQIRQANERIQQDIQPIQAAMQQFEAGAVTTFRQRLQPFINQIAQKRGVDVVIYKGPNVLFYGNKADLTADVTKAAKEFFAKDMPLIDPALGAVPSLR